MGKIRLELVRSQLLGIEGQEPDLETVRFLYRTWRDDPEYLLLQKQTIHSDGSTDHLTIASKCSKRGNDKYTIRSKKRIDTFRIRGDSDVVFLDFKKARQKAFVFFVTLTCPVREVRLTDAWTSWISEKWNRWITGMRKQYGKISAFRVWESTERGYPHVHAMLVFRECEFDVERHFSEDGVTWRVALETKNQWAERWGGFVDVRAARTYSGILRYLEKRILKGTDKTGSESESFEKAMAAGDLTMAMMWLFRKRSFALSKDLQKAMMDKLQAAADLIALKRNSNPGTLSPTGDRVLWVVLGVFGASEIGVEAHVWFSEVDWPSLGLEPRMSAAYLAKVSQKFFESSSRPEPEVDYGRYSRDY